MIFLAASASEIERRRNDAEAQDSPTGREGENRGPWASEREREKESEIERERELQSPTVAFLLINFRVKSHFILLPPEVLRI